jgi:phosphoglycolate phosphatase
MIRKRNFIFDFDGTLFDSSDGILKAIEYAISEMGLPQLHFSQLKRFIGPPLSQSFGTYCGLDKQASAEAIKHLRVYYKSEGVLQADLYPGIDLMLENLLSRDKKLFIATSKPTVFAEQILQRFGMLDEFEFIQGSGLVGDILEKTEILYSLKKAVPDLDSNDSVMVGDTIHDVHGAHNTGMSSVAVLYGFGETNDLLRSRPTHIAESVSALNSVLN